MLRLIVALLVLGLALPSRAQTPLERAVSAATAATETGNWPAAERSWLEAAAIAGEKARINPADRDSAHARDVFSYNAACAAARQGKVHEAFAQLETLLDGGWLDGTDLLGTDPDLDILRADLQRWPLISDRSRHELAEAMAGHAEGLILVPARGTKGRVPGIVALHGAGANVENWSGHWQEVADRTGAVIILVRGSVVQARGMFSWNQQDTQRDVARIEEWIGRAREQVPALRVDELHLAGFSQGGGMAWLLGTEGPRAWAGIIPLGAYVQVAARPRAMAQPEFPLAVFAFMGTQEEEAIREVNVQLVGREGLSHYRARLETFPGGHVLPPDFPSAISRALRWCRKAQASMKR